MGWFTTFWNSSIGKKIVMAITGSLLIIFLIIHLIGNLTLYFGPDVFTAYVSTLEGFKPLVRFIEVVLALIFVLHILNGSLLWYENKQVRPAKYAVNAASKNSTVFSRTMFVSGSIVFIFLVVHLRTFWYIYNFRPNGATLYDIVIEWFAMPWYSILYVISMILLGYHLNHGFQSAFQTFGLNHKKYTPVIQKIGTLYAVIMAVGFGSFPVYFLIRSLTGGI